MEGLEDKNVECSAESRSLASEVSEGCLKTIRVICYFELRCNSGQLGQKSHS